MRETIPIFRPTYTKTFFCQKLLGYIQASYKFSWYCSFARLFVSFNTKISFIKSWLKNALNLSGFTIILLTSNQYTFFWYSRSNKN